MRFENQTAVVAACGSDAGAACALNYLQQGAKVALYYDEEARLWPFDQISEEERSRLLTIQISDFRDHEELKRAADRALRDAGLQPADLDYINAHGTSTPLNDMNETQSLKKALGDEAYRIPVSSTKAYSGHLIAAAGSFESIVCLQAMAAGIMPATAHLTQPDPQCDLDYIAEGHRQGEIRRALNLSFGFGGANAALVLEKHA